MGHKTMEDLTVEDTTMEGKTRWKIKQDRR